jgi:hypothetical protein
MTTRAAHPPSISSWTRAWSLSPAIILGLIALPFLYHDSVGDPDMLLMLNGVLQFPARADQWNPLHKYGILFSWGYYWLLYHLPGQFRENASQLIGVVNIIGWGSTVLACGALGWLTERLYGLGTSLALTIAVAFSPMVLELATYGHPFMLSVALLLLAGICLIEGEARHGPVALAARAASSLLVFASLAVRTESVIALPWLALVTPRESFVLGRTVRRIVTRCPLFGAAYAAFLVVQRGIMGGHGVVLDSLGIFFQSFYNPGKLLHGVVVLVLSSGLALVAAAFAFSVWRLVRRDAAHYLLPSLALLGPALLLWLPVPTPSRHFFFALVATAELFALSATSALGARRAVATALVVVVLNQAGAEFLYGPITRSYWPEERGPKRLATGSVTLGASLPYHSAMLATHRGLREEGRRLARVPNRNVIFFGDAADYLILALLEREGPQAWVDTLEAGFAVERISRSDQTFHIVTMNKYRPRDVVSEYMSADPFPEAKVYIQESARSAYDPSAVPPGRRLLLH